MPPQIPRGSSPACPASESLTTSRIPIHTLLVATPRWGTGADVPTRPALHAPRRLRPQEVRSRRRVLGATGKLQLFFSSESHLRIEPYKDAAVGLFFLRAQRGLGGRAGHPQGAQPHALERGRPADERPQRGPQICAPERNARARAICPGPPLFAVRSLGALKSCNCAQRVSSG